MFYINLKYGILIERRINILWRKDFMKKRLKIAFTFFLIVLSFLLISCTSDSDSNGSNGPDHSVVIETTRKVYYTVEYTFETKKCEEIKNKITSEVEKYSGYIESSLDEEIKSKYVYKVPTNQLNSFLKFIDELGEHASTKSVQSTDITTEYSEIEARKEVLIASRQAYLSLLTKEELTMTEILSIQSKLSELDSEIATIEKNLNYYDHLLNYSTITIYYQSPKSKPSFTSEYFSFLGNFFLGIGQVILYLLPFIVIIGGIVTVVIFIDRRNKKRRLQRKKEKEEHQNINED